MGGAKTLIVILHFGSLEDTLACLDSLRRSVVSPFDAFVVNNGPDRDVESILKTEYPGIIYRNAGLETGFAAGNNIGLRFSLEHGYDYSLLLNNDMIAEQDFLQPLTRLLDQNPTIAMAGPAIYYNNNKERLWSCGGWMNRWSGAIAGESSLDHLDGEQPDVDYLPGACILVRNDLLGKIGLMPEEYFLGMEEADWAIRTRRAGFRVVACPQSVVLHKVGISSRLTPELIYNGFRNRFLFLHRQFLIPVNWFLTACVLVSGLQKHSLNRRLCWRAFKDHCRYRTIRRSHLEKVRTEIKAPV